MMDGLGAIGQAAISVGGYEVIAFEKNRDMWKEAQKVLLDHIMFKENQEQSIAQPFLNHSRFDFVFNLIF